VVAHERYTEKSAGGKLMAGIYPLHTGSFFGLPGILLMMISALILPLFPISGWWMFMDRHRREEHAAMAATRLRAGKGNSRT
jgi:sulfite reductase (NADPH) flavoprotein alpha-component